MEKQAVDKLMQVEEMLCQNEHYQLLMAEHNVLKSQFLAVLEELEKAQQDAICDYLALLIQMHTEMLLAACE